MILLYPIFIIISILIPRNKKVWVFGYDYGFNENTRYFFEYASQKNEFNCYWLANSKEEMIKVTNLGYKSVLKRSLHGYWISAQANITFITKGYNDVNRVLALKSIVINFWHGTPIKKIYLDSKHDLARFGKNSIARFISKNLMQFLLNRIDFFYSSNELERKLVCNSANISLSKSKALGSPRFDKLLENPKNRTLEKLKIKFKKIILYAPTWRDNKINNKNFIIKKNDYAILNKKLKEIDALLIIKPHPCTDINELLSINLIESENIIYSNKLKINNMNTLYYYSDILITDISSAIFDYLIFDRPITLFMPDINQYLSKERGIYNYFNDTLSTYAIKEWKELPNYLDKTNQYIPFLENIAKEVLNYKNTNEKIYDDIKNRFY